MEEKICYVYAYIRLDTNTYFYIGKGKRNRYKDTNGRNNHFLSIINSVPYKIEFLYENLTDEQALNFEVKTIHHLVFNEGYGIDIEGYEKPYQTKRLCNATWGGEGCSGHVHTEEWKQQQSERFSGENNPFYGKKHTEEARKKNKEKHIGVYPTEETREKLSNMRKGEGNNMWGRRGELSPHWGKKHSEERKDNISKALGTSVRCIELDIEFNSLNKAEQYMVNTYNIRFSHKTLKTTIEGKRKKDWYGEIEINGELVKLHWEYC